MLQYEFKWNILWSQPYAGWLLAGLATTLRLAAIGWVIACLLGILAGALRTVPFAPVRLLASAYVEFFRNVPLLVWMFFWYFGAPQVLPAAAQDTLNRLGVEFLAAVMALGVYHGARFSEVIRAGIQSIPRTQLEAALSTGLSVAQAYRHIILPVALRLIIPPLTNESLNLLKNSSLALTIGVAEVTFQARQIESYTAKGIEALTAGTLIYLALCLGISVLMARVERRFAIPGMIARAGAAEH